jgi:DNA-binding response OmpR family regulator
MKTIEGLKAGEPMIILKPFSFEELVERIKIHLDAKRSRILTLGHITIDLTNIKF